MHGPRRVARYTSTRTRYGVHRCVCTRHSYYMPHASCMQELKHRIDNHYRVNMVLDNLPVTVYDLLDEVRSEGH